MDWSPLVISLKVSAAATFLSFLFGMPVAYLLGKRRFSARPLAIGIANLPLVMPPTVLGYFLLVLFGRYGTLGHIYQSVFHRQLVFTWQGAALAAAVASSPLLVSQARLAFESVGRAMEDSARVFGATELQIFWHITLPLARRGVIAGVTLAYARALGDFGTTLMVAGSIPGRTRTMPLAIYDALQTDDDHAVLVFVIISAAVTLLLTVLATRFSPDE